MERGLAIGVIFSLFVCAGPASSEEAPIRVYVFSRDSAFGIEDERLDTFRRELGKYAAPAMAIGYGLDESDVSVQFLGSGRLSIELDTSGTPVRHLWTPDAGAPKMWAILRARRSERFAKEFSIEGSKGRDLSRMAKDIGDWIKKNRSRLGVASAQ